MKRLGVQLIIDMEGCNPKKLDDMDFLEKTMVEAAEVCGATVLKTGFQKFSPIGVSGFIVIAESHLSVHSFPEYFHASIDIYTCGTKINPYKSLGFLLEKLECQSHKIREIIRGTDSVDEDS